MTTRPNDLGEQAEVSSYPSIARQLIPLNAMILLGFMTVGLPLPVLPLFGTEWYGASSVMVGILVGLQSLTTLVSRPFAGKFADTHGSKAATILGLWLCVATGAFYVISCFLPLGLVVLLCGRVTLGIGESLVLTGAITWGIGRVGADHSGQVMSWNGIAMYGALAAAAPIGLLVYQSFSRGVSGFAALGALTSLLSIIALIFAYRLNPVPAVFAEQVRTGPLLKSIWPFGVALTLLMSTYGVIASFYSLLFDRKNWNGAAIGFIVFGIAVISIRVLFGKLPDRFGGRTVALCSMAAACAGQALTFAASSPMVAIIGAGVTGVGVALGFPALGVEAMRRVPASSRGMMVAIFSAFQDLAFGATGPLAGLLILVFHGDPQTAFAFGCFTPFLAIVILLSIKRGHYD